MCKILIMNSIKNTKLAQKFIENMAAKMSERNDDGIGYTAVDTRGNVFAEKWVNNYQFLDTDYIMTPQFAKKLEATGVAHRLPYGALDTNYYSLGKRNLKELATITLHTRFATEGAVNISNTHPFISKNVSLIHNGGITNHKELKLNKISKCDSEAALQTYIKQDIVNNFTAAQDWINMLKGRWAFGVLARNKENQIILDILRGASWLYVAEIEGLGRVFSTDDSDIKAVAKELKLEFLVEPSLVESNKMYRYNAVTSEFLGEQQLRDSDKNITTWTARDEDDEWDYRTGKWIKKAAKLPAVTYDDTKEYTDEFGFTHMVAKNPTATTNTETTQTTTTTRGADRPYTKREEANLLAKYLSQDPDYPDVFKDGENGEKVYDDKKLAQFVRDYNTPIEVRLTVWDDRFGTNRYDVYTSLPTVQKDVMEDIDFENGFFEVSKALRLIDEATPVKKEA